MVRFKAITRNILGFYMYNGIYISIRWALNIPDYEGSPADWHPWGSGCTVSYEKIRYFGNGEAFNTNHIYENYGIFNASDWLREHGHISHVRSVFASDRKRSILDSIWWYITDIHSLMSMRCYINDFINSLEDANEVLSMTGLMRPYLSKDDNFELDRWIDNEQRNFDF